MAVIFRDKRKASDAPPPQVKTTVQAPHPDSVIRLTDAAFFSRKIERTNRPTDFYMRLLAHILVILGLICVVVGVTMIDWRIGLLVAGVVLLINGLFVVDVGDGS